MRIRPCIDIKDGKVVQIVGGTLRADGQAQTNFIAEQSPAYFATLFRRCNLTGGHVIALGPGNDQAVADALGAWPRGLQYGGGVSPENARRFLEMGASHVIVTSWLFEGEKLSLDRCRALSDLVGAERLVIDLSCRRHQDGYYRVMCNRWQTWTETRVIPELFGELEPFCAEFLVHAVDMEGRRSGVEWELVNILKHSPLPVTYAGGVSSFTDLEKIAEIGEGKVDVTVGSALDLFGGHMAFEQIVQFHNRLNRQNNEKTS